MRITISRSTDVMASAHSSMNATPNEELTPEDIPHRGTSYSLQDVAPLPK
jgi:hypothetical protein